MHAIGILHFKVEPRRVQAGAQFIIALNEMLKLI